jgi:uncharacterized membrane protein
LYAAIGAGLVLLHWGMDRLATAIGHRGGTSQAVVAGAGGFMIRFVVIGGLLVLVGLLSSREQFLSCILSFMAVYTIALFLRILSGRMAVQSR